MREARRYRERRGGQIRGERRKCQGADHDRAADRRKRACELEASGHQSEVRFVPEGGYRIQRAEATSGSVRVPFWEAQASAENWPKLFGKILGRGLPPRFFRRVG